MHEYVVYYDIIHDNCDMIFSRLCLVQILRAYLELFMCKEAVTSEGSGPHPLPGTRLALPSSSNPLDYSSLVDSLPDSDSPALFGLPANINREVGRAASTAVIAQLKQITTSQVRQCSLAPLLGMLSVSCDT